MFSNLKKKKDLNPISHLIINVNSFWSFCGSLFMWYTLYYQLKFPEIVVTGCKEFRFDNLPK